MLVFNGTKYHIKPLNVLNGFYEHTKELSLFVHLWTRRQIIHSRTSIATTISLIVVGVLLYMPGTVGIRHVVPAFAQLSPDCANDGSNQINAEVSKHSHAEGNHVQSQANQCAPPPPKCPLGHTGTNSTEDETSNHEEVEVVSATGSCFPDGEDEPSEGDENEGPQ